MMKKNLVSKIAGKSWFEEESEWGMQTTNQEEVHLSLHKHTQAPKSRIRLLSLINVPLGVNKID